MSSALATAQAVENLADRFAIHAEATADVHELHTRELAELRRQVAALVEINQAMAVRQTEILVQQAEAHEERVLLRRQVADIRYWGGLVALTLLLIELVIGIRVATLSPVAGQWACQAACVPQPQPVEYRGQP